MTTPGRPPAGTPSSEPADEWAGERARLARTREVARLARGMPREPMGWVARSALAAATGAWLTTLAWLAATLPARVPQHWGSAGSIPDGWADRSTALATSVLLPVLVYLLLLLGRLPLRWPDGVHGPHKDWWFAEPQRAVRFERLFREDLAVMVSLVLLALTGGDVIIGVAAHRPGGAVPEGVFVAVLLVFLLAIGGVVGRMVLGGRYAPGGRVD